jgi:hypothetical protein
MLLLLAAQTVMSAPVVLATTTMPTVLMTLESPTLIAVSVTLAGPVLPPLLAIMSSVVALILTNASRIIAPVFPPLHAPLTPLLTRALALVLRATLVPRPLLETLLSLAARMSWSALSSMAATVTLLPLALRALLPILVLALAPPWVTLAPSL